MPTEVLNPSVVHTESPAASIEYTGKHLEAAFAHRTRYHKERILRAFGEDRKLPPLPRGDLNATLTESDKRYRKASDMLYREQPMALAEVSGDMSRDSLIALADNLAWKGIEKSITLAQLGEVDKALKRLSSTELKAHRRALVTISLEDNHFYRDFFDSRLAADLGLDSPADIKRFLARTSMTSDDSEAVTSMGRGISLEIAVRRFLSGMVGDNGVVNFGSKQQDREGGDVVVVREHKILYIDLKNGVPRSLAQDEIEAGFHLHADLQKNIYSALVWPETSEAVASESFRLTDPTIKKSLHKIILLTR